MTFLDRLIDTRTYKKQKRTCHPNLTNEMAFFAPSITTSNQFLNPPSAPVRKRSQRFLSSRDDVDDFLSSDLELSFASTVSLHSPPRDATPLAPDSDYAMDISPAPPPKPAVSNFLSKEGLSNGFKSTRPRAATSAARLFGNDISNNGLSPTPKLAPAPMIKPGSTHSSSKRIQRSALPTEWLSSLQAQGPPKQTMSSVVRLYAR